MTFSSKLYAYTKEHRDFSVSKTDSPQIKHDLAHVDLSDWKIMDRCASFSVKVMPPKRFDLQHEDNNYVLSLWQSRPVLPGMENTPKVLLSLPASEWTTDKLVAAIAPFI